MNTSDSRISSSSTLVLKTKLFNDEDIVGSSLQTEFTDSAFVLDISDKFNAEFTDTDWDKILSSILLSSKVITV